MEVTLHGSAELLVIEDFFSITNLAERNEAILSLNNEEVFGRRKLI